MSFWKETSCRIQCAPVAGESGCTYRRPGMAGSAFPVTDLDQGEAERPASAPRSAAGSHAWPGLPKVRMIWKWPDPQVSLARRWYQASFPPQLFFLPPHPSPQHQGRPRGLAAPRCPPSGRFWEPRCAKKVSEKSLRAFEGGFVFKSWQLWERPTQGTGLSSPLLPVLLKYHGPILQFHKKAGSKRVTHKK